MYNEYRDHGFVALAINLWESMDNVVKVYARQNTNPYLRDGGGVWAVYNQTNGIPLNYVVDTAGIIRFWQTGFNEATIRSYIEQYLPGQIEHDVGVMGLVLPQTADSGIALVPSCSLMNYASNTETYPVRLRIGTEYDTTVTVTAHAPGTIRHVQFPDWYPSTRGSQAVRCSTELPGDDIPFNDGLRRSITVNVYDVVALAILAPADSVDSGVAVVPRAIVANRGNATDMAKVIFYIGTSYAESASVSLIAGRTDTVDLRPWTPTELGTIPVRCTVATFRPDMFPANNLLTSSVKVIRTTGIAEPEPAGSGPVRFGPVTSPARRASMGYTLEAATPVVFRIYSSNGKLVRMLDAGVRPAGHHVMNWDGRDESGRPAGTGAYFCHIFAGDANTIHKLTIVE